MEINLSALIFEEIEALGNKAPKFFGKSADTIAKWKAGTGVPDVLAAQKVLDKLIASGVTVPVPEAEVFETPPPQGLTIPPPAPGAEGEKAKAEFKPPAEPTVAEIAKKLHPVSILMPCHRDIPPAVVLSLLGNWKSSLPHELLPNLSGLDMETDTLIHRARNILATRFLESKREWSFWLDSDIISQTGNPAWFARRAGARFDQKFTSVSALNKLTSYKDKLIVSGVYAERNAGGKLINQIGLNPQGKADETLAQALKSNGPQEKVIPVGWSGFGCIAVHRKVFADILEQVEGVKAAKDGEPHGFFTAFEGGPQGEDVAFCKRAKQAGHTTFLDLSVFCGHVGKFSFLP